MLFAQQAVNGLCYCYCTATQAGLPSPYGASLQHFTQQEKE